MSAEVELSYMERQFGHSVIKWNIHDFCLFICDDDLTIDSPEFYVRGPFVTKWKLVLSIKPRIDENGSVLIYLQRLDYDGGPEVLGVNWKAYLTTANNNNQHYGEIDSNYSYSNLSNWTVYEEKLSFIIDKLKPLTADILCIRFHLLVTFQDNIKVGKPTDLVHASLSNDLSALFKRSKFCDLLIKIGSNELRVHKAILHSRNKQFAEYIRSNEGNNVMSVDEELVDYSSMEKVIAYLYTGNLEHVLNEPSISIQECSLRLNIDELKAYYLPDEVALYSSINKEEMVFTWSIKWISKIGESCFLSPHLSHAFSDTIWRLRFYPKGIGNDMEYASIFAEVVEGMKRMDVCLEFGIVSRTEDVLCHKRLCKCMEIGEQVAGFSDFIRKDVLLDRSIISRDTLKIIFKIRISNKSIQSGTDTNFISIISPSMNKNESYEYLASDMLSLFHTDTFKDLRLVAGDESFSVHKCLVAARSRSLSTLASKLKAGEDTLPISNINPNVLRIVVQFIYSNKLDDLALNVRLEVYEAARKLMIPALTEACMEYFMNNLRVDNVCDILIFAHNNNDDVLIRKSLNAITEAPTHFFAADLSRLREVNQSLYNEIRLIYHRVGFL